MPGSDDALRARLADPLARTVVQTLLARAARPDRQRVVRFHVHADSLPAYFDRLQAGPRTTANHALTALARSGYLQVHWAKWQENQWLEAVDLVPDDDRIAALYAACGLEPADRQRQRLLAVLDGMEPQSVWLQDFKAHVERQLAACKSPAPLKLDDPTGNEALLKALAAIDHLTGPTLERTLSVQAFGDSKRFDDVRRAVITVLKRFSAVVPPEADDRSVLRLHGVERTPELIHLAGPLRLQTDAGWIDVAAARPYLALPATMVPQGWATTARLIVTVENLTPFVGLAAAAVSEVAFIYTGGFASPALLRWLKSLAAAAPTTSWAHWGDVDIGGLRILAQLRSAVPVIRPLAMDESVLSDYPVHTEPLTDAELQALRTLDGEAVMSDCGPVMAAMLTGRRKLEQEALPIPSVVAVIAEMAQKRSSGLIPE